MDISQINRGENNAKGHVWGSSALHLLCCPPSPPTTKRGDVRAFLHVCAHLCTLAILQSARSLLDSHNYQSSQNPTSNFLLLLQHQNMANWNFDNIPKYQFGSFPPKMIIKQCPLQCIIQHVILCSWNQANARSWIFSKWSDAQFWLLHSSTTYSESWTSSAWTTSPLYPPTIRKT